MSEQNSHYHDVLSDFHPLVRQWFTERLGPPTDIQQQAWPIIVQGRHALVTAPTGSGKTLTAFLWAVNQLLTGAWERGRTRVLYVSPQKALNNDIRRNLTAPLEELASYFLAAGEPFAHPGVLTRSGDTPAEERREMLRKPPEILITTPESLNILLSSRSGCAMLTGIATVILDEIHAVAGTKRGTHLMTAVERLVRLSGEFQRLALSATAKPPDTMAEFVGGFIPKRSGQSVHYEKRPVDIVQARDHKKCFMEVRFPAAAEEQSTDGSRWPALVADFKKDILANRSTLLFTNSRRTAEKVTHLINEGEPEAIAYSHHGSLSREIRMAVEQRLKNGELKAIVATSSLELGIDIGELDQVILVQTPPSAASAIQRIGRSGHGIGGISRGILYPTHGPDFLSAAVMANSVNSRDMEAIVPVECPLDVLAQVIVSAAGIEKWHVDDLFAAIKSAYPYRNLTRRQFDLVLDMLAGRYANTKLRELKPRISLDKIEQTVQGKEGVLRLVYLSGGTIPDRGYYDLRVQDSHAKIGELDEEFVWERSVGDTFTLGAQAWRILRVTHNDVEVSPAEMKPGMIPFWRAEEQDRAFHFSEKILRFLESCHNRLADPALKEALQRSYLMDEAAADELLHFLGRQKEATGTALPHRHHLLIEHVDDPLEAGEMKQVILHTLWGGRINRPFGLALQAAWEETYHERPEIVQNNDCLLIMLPHAFSAKDILPLVTPENLERLLRRTLEKSGFFGAKFRENAGRALLLPRGSFKRRLPLWLNRLRSQKLMDSVMMYPDFPILLETWRACLHEGFDLANLKMLLNEIGSNRIKVTETTTRAASPFAGGLIWKQTNTYMYADDSPLTGQESRLSRELLEEVLFSARLRPRLPRPIIETLEGKLQRTAPGYAPASPQALLDWVKDRYVIPVAEWEALMAAMARDHELPADRAIEPIRKKILTLCLPGAGLRLICAAENLAGLLQAFQDPFEALDIRDVLSHEPWHGKMLRPADGGGMTLPDIFLQWLSFYGPVRRTFICEVMGFSAAFLDRLLVPLADSQDIVVDLLAESATEEEICDRENLEILLRMARKSRRPAFRALGIDRLPLFLAAWQGLTAPGGTLDDLKIRLEQLFGYPAPAEAWEQHILPARLSPYDPSGLDTLMQTSSLLWFGCGSRKISFAFAEDLELFGDPRPGSGKRKKGDTADDLTNLLPGRTGRYAYPDIVRFSKLHSRDVSEKLWDLAWQGRITNDSLAAPASGHFNGFCACRPEQRERALLPLGL